MVKTVLKNKLRKEINDLIKYIVSKNRDIVIDMTPSDYDGNENTEQALNKIKAIIENDWPTMYHHDLFDELVEEQFNDVHAYYLIALSKMPDTMSKLNYQFKRIAEIPTEAEINKKWDDYHQKERLYARGVR